MPKPTINVLLSANEAFKAVPTLLMPAGVTLQLKRGGAGHALGPTDQTGKATGPDVPAEVYTIEVLDPDFAGWTPHPDSVTVDDDTEHTITLSPPTGTWLLPLLLRHYGHGEGPAGVPGAEIKTDAGASLRSRADGYVYAALRPGTVILSFGDEDVPGLGRMKPQNSKIKFEVCETHDVEVTEVQYLADATAPASASARISIEPKIRTVSGEVPLTGARATIEYATPSSPDTVSPAAVLGPGEQKIWFNDLLPAIYSATVTPPATFNGWPVEPGEHPFLAERVWHGRTLEHAHSFRFQKVTVTGRVQAADGRLVDHDVRLEIYGAEHFELLTVNGGTFEVELDWGVPLNLRLARNAEISIGDVPLDPVGTAQPLSLTGDNVVVLPFRYGMTGQAVDEADNPVPGAIIDVFDDQQQPTGSVAADADGNFIVGTPGSGRYFVAAHTDPGGPVTRQLVDVGSVKPGVKVRIPATGTPRATRWTGPDDGDGDGRPGRVTREALTDLAAYPVLTEEVSTTGPPAPIAGGRGGGTGAGYGPTVDQAIRDVLGWRPGGDVAGFQAALTGAFSLREVEGHTEWTWQQRGYAVQADMGALTGAQASIYARAKSALDQILPLLGGLAPLNPALFPEQDREAIRTVVTTEITELVSELALEGGPRIQRVDELFGLLLGDEVGSTNLNPDIVQGQLGILRQRFALTPNWIETVDDERVVTNFRIIIEQILALQASWSSDYDLLSVLDSRAALGTVLIYLSRGLEAVCESVNDLTFALDSVYVDAAQRQVIQLSFGSGQPPLLLSDLLDWIVRATRDEGPRLIQDAGRDGVRAFAPVLRRLRGLVGQTTEVIKDPSLPPGLHTPRVTRALQVLHDQLREATRLAGLVHLDQAPVITDYKASTDECTGVTTVHLTGANFRNPAAAVLLVADQEDIPDVQSWYANADSATAATVTFRIPGRRVNWQIVFINGDGTQSYPPFPIHIKR